MMIRALMLASFAGCHGGTSPDDTDSDAPLDTDVPDGPITVVGPIEALQPSEFAPYSREVHARLSQAAPLHVVATDGTVERVYDLPAAQSHTVPLAALYAGRTWTVTLWSGDRRLGSVAFTTEPLPQPFPNVTVRASAPERSAPGLTVFPVQGGPERVQYLVACDELGEVAWILNDPDRGYQEVSTRDGDLFVLGADSAVERIDWMGRVAWRWSASDEGDVHLDIASPALHHEAFQRADGSFALLTRGSATADVYPSDFTPEAVWGPATIQTDTLLTVDSSDGSVLASYPLEEILDTSRVGYDSLNAEQFGADWTHSNAIARDEGRGLWLVSVRNQDAVVALDDDGRIAWILSTPANWRAPWSDALLAPVGAFDWPIHQHAISWNDDRLLMFDNHIWGAYPFTGEDPVEERLLESRVREFQIDPEAGTVSLAWEWQPEQRLIAAAGGDADRLPNGNILAVFGDVRFEGGVFNETAGRGWATSRVIEFDPVSGDTLLDVDVWAANTDATSMWRVYRAARVEDPR